MLGAAKELKVKDKADFFFDLVGVVCATNGSQDYINGIRKMWREIRDDAIPEFRTPRVEYDSGVTKIPWKQATELMVQQMAIMQKVNR